MGGPCDYRVSQSPFGLDIGTLDFGTSDLGLTIATLKDEDGLQLTMNVLHLKNCKSTQQVQISYSIATLDSIKTLELVCTTLRNFTHLHFR